MRKLSLDELGRVSSEQYRSTTKIPLVVVLDNVRSAANVGSFFRTADAFLIQSLYLCGITAQPPHKEISKTAIGASQNVSWQYFGSSVEAVQSLKEDGYQIYGIEQTSVSRPLESIEIAAGEKIAVVFGNEVSGLSDEILEFLDVAVEIPQFGTKHSLNVSVCGGIVLHHYYQKMSL